MIKRLFFVLFILPLFYAPWPPGGAAACHISGKDLTNFKNKNVSPLAPVPQDENDPAITTASAPRRTSSLKREESKSEDSKSVDLTALDSTTVVVPSASGGSR